MSDSAQQHPWRMRLGFVLILISAAVLLFAFLLLVENSAVGGQSAESPNGVYRIGIMRELDAEPGDPYRVTLSIADSGEAIQRITIEPVRGRPNQGLRETSQTIQWSADSTYADVVLDGQKMIRIFVPES